MSDTLPFDALPSSQSFSPGVTITRRQLDTMLRGQHPISGHRLHPRAADPLRANTAPGLRCRTCFFALRQGLYFKCGADDGNHINHSPVTDLRLWFPACTQYAPDTPLTDQD